MAINIRFSILHTNQFMPSTYFNILHSYLCIKYICLIKMWAVKRISAHLFDSHKPHDLIISYRLSCSKHNETKIKFMCKEYRMSKKERLLLTDTETVNQKRSIQHRATQVSPFCCFRTE